MSLRLTSLSMLALRFVSSVLPCLALGLLVACRAAPPDSSDPTGPQLETVTVDMDALDRWIDREMAARGVPGLAAVVVQDGRLVYQATRGLDDIEARTAFGVDTWARLASATKVLTGLVFLSAAEDGLIDLDETLGETLPAVTAEPAPRAWREIPLWRLLDHTAGLPMVVSREDFQAMTGPDLAALEPRQIYEWMRVEPLDFAPGDRSRYQQSGYALLAMSLVERTGKSWPELVDEHVTRPAGLEETRYADSLTESPINYQVREGTDGELERSAYFYSPALAMGAGWNTTANDLRRLFAALDRGDIVSHDSLEQQLFDPEHIHRGKRDAEGEGYGLATIVKRFGSSRTIGHSGGGGLADIRYAPEERVGIAVLTNLGSSGLAIDLTDEISRQLFGPAVEPPADP